MPRDFHNSVMPTDVMAPVMQYHVTEHICTLPGNRLVSLVRLKGVNSDTRSDEDLVQLFHQRNRYFLALGKREGKNLAIHSYITKNGIELDTEYQMPLPELQNFVDAYTEPFRNGTFFQVGYAFALVLRYRTLDEGIQRMNDLLTLTTTMLADYAPTVMGIEENEYGALFSQIGRFYSLLFNGHEQDILLSDTRLGDAVIDSITNFGEYDFVENRPNRGGRRFATTYDLRDYQSKPYPGMWDEAIEQQYEFTLVQVFMFEDRNKAKLKFKKHIADLGSVEGDNHQTDELEAAVEAITLGEKAFGRYYASLIVYGKTQDEAIDNGSRMSALFQLQDSTFVRSTMSNNDTWYTQFPGVTNAMYPMIKSTENLACGFSLHATPTGKARGHPIGDGTALMPVRTLTGGMHLLNLHDSPPGQNNMGEMLPAHTAFHGQTGVGKTTIVATVVTFASRFDPGIFCIDYDQSLRHLLEALNTSYFVLQPGEFTGINPFQFRDCAALRQLLYDNVLCAASGGIENNPDEQSQVIDSIEAVMTYPETDKRGMSLLLQNITYKGNNCLHSRLLKWCRDVKGQHGQYAWVIDAPVNQFDAQSYRRIAFDLTTMLKDKDYPKRHPQVMEVLLNTLFYMKREMQQARRGSLLFNIVSEYWAPLSFASTASAIQEVLQGGRKRGEILIMDTQFPEQATETPYAPAIIQQMITLPWLPNRKAQAASYAKFGVDAKMFAAIKDMHPLSREMIVQQGSQAVALKMELGEREKYWLPLLSASEKNLATAERVRQHLGSTDPAVWVSPFLVAEAVRLWLNTDDPAIWMPAFEQAEQLCQQMNTRDATCWMPVFQKAWSAAQKAKQLEALT